MLVSKRNVQVLNLSLDQLLPKPLRRWKLDTPTLTGQADGFLIKRVRVYVNPLCWNGVPHRSASSSGSRLGALNNISVKFLRAGNPA
jgi:hypothetical protein